MPSKARIPQSGRYRASIKSIGDPADIERLADILVQAKKPCVLLGTQVWTCRGTEAAINFVKTLNIPAFMNGAGRGTLPPSDPHHFQQTRRYAFDKADVIVIVGTPFDFRMGYGRRLRADATVVQIDMDYRTVGKNRDISLGLVGDVGAILGAVTQAVSGRVNRGVTSASRGWRNYELKKIACRATVWRGSNPMRNRFIRYVSATKSTSFCVRILSISAMAAIS